MVLVLASLVFIAYKTPLAEIILGNDHGLDITVWGEEFLYIGFRHVDWYILEVQIVDHFLGLFIGIFGREAENDILVSWISQACIHTIFVLEADEGISSLGIVGVDRDFNGSDFAILCEFIKQELVIEYALVSIFGVFVEHVQAENLCLVVSSELGIEFLAAGLDLFAVLVIKIQSHLDFLACLLVFRVIFDVDHC